MPKTEFDYYYGVEAEQFSFVRVPKVLFTDKEHFGGLSNEAKLTASLFNSVYTLTNSTFAGFEYDMQMKML